MTKHGVVTLSETLYHELALRGAKVKASVLCPGFVNTQIMDSVRNRPARLQNDPTEEQLGPGSEALIQFMRQAVEAGMPPQQVADIVFEAIRDENFYILTHPELKEAIRVRMEDILQERHPTLIPILE